MIVLVCGGRDYRVRHRVFGTLADLHRREGPIKRIVHGAARGADSLADAWADAQGIPVGRYKADWIHHRRRAGPIRNQRMLDEEKPDLVLAFPGGAGTASMVGLARAAGVRVIEVSP